jgi:hypothetical protein
MIAPLLEMLAITFVAVFLVHIRATARRRNTQTWESLVSRLRSDWSARELTEHFLWREGLDANPEDTWKRIRGPQGLCAMFQNAGVMVEMADFAARNCDSVDLELVEILRADAMQIRISVSIALFEYAFSQVNNAISVNSYRAASMYTGMAARMTQLLQANAAEILPDFVAAM